MSDSENIYFSHLFKKSCWIPIIKAPYIILIGRNNGLFVFETYSVCGRKTAKWVTKTKCVLSTMACLKWLAQSQGVVFMAQIRLRCHHWYFLMITKCVHSLIIVVSTFLLFWFSIPLKDASSLGVCLRAKYSLQFTAIFWI